MRVAALTMVYNEPDFLPVWLRHYSAQLGAENCYIIDHASDDGSTADLAPANVIRVPRIELEEAYRCRVNEDLIRFLLHSYDAVYRTDVDELLVPDPLVAANLVEFLSADRRPVIRSIGFDVADCMEPPLDLNRPISTQRRWLQFYGLMCKSVLVREPVRWFTGFHQSKPLPRVGRLFLFHLRYCDLACGLRRLRTTRDTPRKDPQFGQYARWSDDRLRKYHLQLAARDRVRSDLGPDDGALNRYLDPIANVPDDVKPDLQIRSEGLFTLPDRFVGTF